jgi:iron(III) transport system substrate-binding protein
MKRRPIVALFALLIVGVLLIAGCQPVAVPPVIDQPTAPEVVDAAQPTPETPAAEEAAIIPMRLVIYSGRNENLVGPLLAQFQEETGIAVEVRYGGTAEMAATILEEGVNSPADVFYGQDAGSLGALEQAGRLRQLPEDVLNMVDARFRSLEGGWLGTSGRARVFVYNTNQVAEDELPGSIWDLLDPQWQNRVGWAPTNGSFQSFVTALRVLEGEQRATEWLEGMLANGVQSYANNTQIVEAVGSAEVDLGLTNHYYLIRYLIETPTFPARNYHPTEGGAGAMINIAGVGIIDTATNVEAARAFVVYLLSEEAQQYFVEQTNEYPLIQGITVNDLLVPFEEINVPDIDLAALADLQGTLELLQDVGALD